MEIGHLPGQEPDDAPRSLAEAATESVGVEVVARFLGRSPGTAFEDQGEVFRDPEVDRVGRGGEVVAGGVTRPVLVEEHAEEAMVRHRADAEGERGGTGDEDPRCPPPDRRPLPHR